MSKPVAMSFWTKAFDVTLLSSLAGIAAASDYLFANIMSVVCLLQAAAIIHAEDLTSDGDDGTVGP